MTLAEVIQAIDEMQLRIIGGAKPAIYPPQRVEDRKRFQGMREWLETYRLEILAHYEPPAPRQLCPMCRRDVTDAEDRERLAGVNPWCTIAALPQGWDREKQKPIPAKPGCPYRMK